MLNATSAAPRLLAQKFSTSSFAPRDRIAAWRELYGHTIAQLDFEPSGDDVLNAEANLRKLPGLGLVSMASTEVQFHKPKSFTTNDDVILLIVDSGYWSGTQLGRDVHLQAGDATLCTNAETACGKSLGRRVMLRVPHGPIASVLPDIHAAISCRIPGEARGLRLLRQYLGVLQDTASLAAPDFQRAIVAHVYDLLTLTLGARRDLSIEADQRGGWMARLHAVKVDIARHLAQGDVSLAAVAARHRMTPRTLQKLFERGGATFSDHVLGERLAHAHRLLSDRRFTGEKIAAVAFAAGFGDLSYFYRAFRRRYGMLPTEVRSQANPH